jgi:RNA polymerase sigma-70 factor (sigma-E family)
MEWFNRAAAKREFEAFVLECTAPLLRTGYLMTWDRQLAEDLVQETFVRVARRWPRVRGMQHPAAYARRVLANLALDHGSRTRRRRDELSEEIIQTPDPAAEGQLRRVEGRRDISAALAGLPPRQRVMLVLRFWEDLSVAETAVLLRCSEGTVKSTTSRGLAALRAQLNPHEESLEEVSP